MKMKIIKDGEVIDLNVITLFRNEETGIDYILYTDGSLDENGKKNLYGSRYKLVNENEIELLDVESDDEWDYIDEVIGGIENGD